MGQSLPNRDARGWVRLQFKTDQRASHRYRINTDLPTLVPCEGLEPESGLELESGLEPANEKDGWATAWPTSEIRGVMMNADAKR